MEFALMLAVKTFEQPKLKTKLKYQLKKQRFQAIFHDFWRSQPFFIN